MRISDWSSDVCSSDLRLHMFADAEGEEQVFEFLFGRLALGHDFEIVKGDMAIVARLDEETDGNGFDGEAGDRKSVVEGKSVSGRGDIGGRRDINKKQTD